MGANDYVHRTVCKTGLDLFRVSCGGETGQFAHGHAETVHTLAERRVMLLGKQGCRHEHRYLFAVLDRFERGAHGNLGLAKTHVAHNHAVHRHRLLHVVLHGLNRGKLVFRLHKRERVLHLVLPRRIRRKRMSRRGLALGVELNELTCDLTHRGARLALGGLPVRAAHLAE